jgi:hypothetical protein
MKKKLEKVMIPENPFNVEAIDSSEKMKTLKVLHLSGNTHHSMALWSRLSERSDIPVDFAVAASHKEVRNVMGDYDKIIVPSRSDLKKLAYAGFDLEKASIMEIKTSVNDRGIHEFHGERDPVSTSYIEDLDDCTEKIILCFTNISTCDTVRWRRAIRMALASLPKEYLRKVPDIYVYNTMMRALTETFNPEHKSLDSIGEEYLNTKVWGFSYLNDPDARNMKIVKKRFQRIVFAIKRHVPGYEWAPPEFTIFHEFGHFWFQSQGKIICKNNEEEIEADCDEYALKCYARLMDKYPFYITISEHDKNRGFEKMISKLLKGVKKSGLKAEKLYEKTASKIMKDLKWRKT